MTKDLECPIDPRGAAHVAGGAAGGHQNDVGIVGDAKTADQAFQFGDRAHHATYTFGILDTPTILAVVGKYGARDVGQGEFIAS